MGKIEMLLFCLLWYNFVVNCVAQDEWQTWQATNVSFPASPFGSRNGTDWHAGLSCIVDPYYDHDHVEDICRVSTPVDGFESAVILSHNSTKLDSMATRLLLAQPRIWYEEKWRVSFTTSFVFSMLSAPQVDLGSGLAFVIVPNNSFPLGKQVEYTLGLFWTDTKGDYNNFQMDGAGDKQTFSVEIDILKDPYDDAVPHVGVNFRDSLKSVNSSYLWDNGTFMGSKIAVWIDYDATQQLLQVWMMNVSTSPPVKEQAVLVLTCNEVDLSSIVQPSSYVGFGAQVPPAPAVYVIHDKT